MLFYYETKLEMIPGLESTFFTFAFWRVRVDILQVLYEFIRIDFFPNSSDVIY